MLCGTLQPVRERGVGHAGTPEWVGILVAVVFLVGVSGGCLSNGPRERKPFPAGYINSPFIVPNGSTLYFIHAVASTRDMLTGNPEAVPVAEYLPGHQGQGGPYWWNTDIYFSRRHPDGTWSMPENLGPPSIRSIWSVVSGSTGNKPC